MSFDIVRAKRDELPAIKAINEISLPEHYSDGFYNRHFTYFAEFFRVAKIEGKIVGYIMCQADVVQGTRIGLIVSVAVHPDYRRKGIGESLIRDAQRVMRENGVQMSTLQVRPSNTNAIALYAKLGYQNSYTIPKYYTDGEDGFLYTLVL
jgi:[ribosomal protein S18]-alanine N-acetyltransferase